MTFLLEKTRYDILFLSDWKQNVQNVRKNASARLSGAGGEKVRFYAQKHKATKVRIMDSECRCECRILLRTFWSWGGMPGNTARLADYFFFFRWKKLRMRLSTISPVRSPS